MAPSATDIDEALAGPKAVPLPGQGFRALTERWTRERVERVVALLHQGDRERLASYLEAEVPKVPHSTDPGGLLDLKGLHFGALPYRVDLGRVRFERLNLWSSRFEDVSLKDARFEGCALGLSTFADAYLRGVEARGCDLHGCTFARSNLQRLRLVDSRIRYSSFTGCKLDVASFPAVLEEEKEGDFAAARDVYTALRLDLNAAGDAAGASWATYRQQQLDRRELRRTGQTLRHLASLALDLFWGYGERPGRLLYFSLAFCVLWAWGYFAAGINVGGQCTTAWSAGASPLDHFFTCLYFSFVTFTTLGYGDISPCSALSRALAMAQAFSGIFVMGLFVSANVRRLSGG